MNRESNVSSSASTSPLLSSSYRGNVISDISESEVVNRRSNGSAPGEIRLENSAGLAGPADRATYYRSHDYEELPSVGNSNYEYSVAQDITPPPTTQAPPMPMFTSKAISSSTPTSTIPPLAASNDRLFYAATRNNNNGPGYRKRVNPMYCTLDRTAKPEEISRSHCCRNCLLSFICVLVLVLNIVACTAFIALYKTGYFVDSRVTDQRFEVLESRYNFLVSVLNGSVPAVGNDSDVAVLRSQMSSVVRDHLQPDLNELQTDLLKEMHNISLLPGPQGPSGAGNLSACKHNVSNIATAAADPKPTETAWIPETLHIAKNWQVMGVACFTDGGNSSYLTTRVFPGQNNTILQYQCICNGMQGKSTSRYCYLHYWMCPMLM